jgi:hypothetical protein
LRLFDPERLLAGRTTQLIEQGARHGAISSKFVGWRAEQCCGSLPQTRTARVVEAQRKLELDRTRSATFGAAWIDQAVFLGRVEVETNACIIPVGLERPIPAGGPARPIC